MGMPEEYPTKQSNLPYQYKVPVQLAHTKTRDPKHEAIDWAISVIGVGPVLVAVAVGFFVMGRAALKRFGVLK